MIIRKRRGAAQFKLNGKLCMKNRIRRRSSDNISEKIAGNDTMCGAKTDLVLNEEQLYELHQFQLGSISS